MTRVISTRYGGVDGLFIANEGYDLDTPNLPRQAFKFSTEWALTVRKVARVNVPYGSAPQITPPGLVVSRRVYLHSTTPPREFIAVGGCHCSSVSLAHKDGQGLVSAPLGAAGYANGFFLLGPVVAGASVLLPQSGLLANFSPQTLRAMVLDYPQTSTTPPPRASGKRKARFSPAGVFIAAPPYEAVTETDPDRYLIHPNGGPLVQELARISYSGSDGYISYTNGGATFWAAYKNITATWASPTERIYNSFVHFLGGDSIRLYGGWSASQTPIPNSTLVVLP